MQKITNTQENNGIIENKKDHTHGGQDIHECPSTTATKHKINTTPMATILNNKCKRWSIGNKNC